MAKILCRTKGNSSPRDKRRVYFTCHPDDFEKYFDKVCEDIFASHDCAVYYTEDMNEAIEEKNLETDLESNNMFVISVTFKLLSTPNRAMDFDFPFAAGKHIPVLPIMMEPGLDVLYSREDKFGEMQYLNPFSTDLTAISYKNKLKKYLDTVLLSDETAKRVRAAFDAYIFLSYRKKDRHLANQLMKMIHSNPEYRDVAIWFDEFLTPGESFRENINKILSDSKLFTLLVTPNLLEENNFVMREEYPAAKESGIDILPAEMEKTDREALEAKYESIPECASTEDEISFRNRLLEEVAKLEIKENDTPEHNYLIGLAYLDGIDVEVNRERGFELITGAAENGLAEAMQKLYTMYREGSYVKLDYQKALYWAQKIVDYYVKECGEEHPDTLQSLICLALAYENVGEYTKSLELNKKVYNLCCKVLGEEHFYALTSLHNLALAYGNVGEYTKSLELFEKVYSLYCKILGEEHPDTLLSLNNLAVAYGKVGEYSKSIELDEKAYALCCKVLGEEHPDTLRSLSNLALSYIKVGKYLKSIELNEKVYALSFKIWGAENPHTFDSLSDLAAAYGEIGEYTKSLELNEKVYSLYCKALGEEHPDTLRSLSNLALSYIKVGKYLKSIELNEKVYSLYCKVLGEEHPDTLTTLNNLAHSYGDVGEYEKSLELNEKVYAVRCKVLGEEHPDTLSSLNNLALAYYYVGEYVKFLEFSEKVYDLRCKVLGEEHPDTLGSLNNLACAYHEIGNFKKSFEYLEKAYSLYIKIFGENHPGTITIKENMEAVKEILKLVSQKNEALEAIKRKRQESALSQADKSDESRPTSENKKSGSLLDRIRNWVKKNRK